MLKTEHHGLSLFLWTLGLAALCLAATPPQGRAELPPPGEWQLFGPVASEKDTGRFRPWFEPRHHDTPLDAAAAMPGEAIVDGVVLTPETVDAGASEDIDFQQKWHTNDGQGVAYLFRQMNLGQHELANMSLHARGWVKVWVNGKLAYSGGDDGAVLRKHDITLPLKPGENIIGLRLAAGVNGWAVRLGQASVISDARALTKHQEVSLEGEGPTLRMDALDLYEVTPGDEGLLIDAASHVAGQLVLDRANPEPDRLVHFQWRPIAVKGRPVECFVQIKEDVQVGFMGQYLEAGDRYQVIWQIRHRGRSVWEVDHYAAKDWAVISPLADVDQIAESRELSRMDLDGLGGRFDQNQAFEWIIATRDDEVTLRINEMENLVLRHRIPGSADDAGPISVHIRGLNLNIMGLRAQPLPEPIRKRWALGDDPPVRWDVPQPDAMLTSGGYPEFPDLEPILLYYANPAQWTFNHHPQIAYLNGRFYAAWSNSFMHEDSAGTRVRGTVSDDGRDWHPSFIMIPSLSEPADEMDDPHKPGIAVWPFEIETFLAVEERVYAVGRAAYRGGYLGQGGHLGLIARRVDRVEDLGPLFWLMDRVPEGGEPYPAFTELEDARMRQDALSLLEQLRLPPDFFDDRSASPRDQFRGAMPEAADHSIISHDPVYRCPDGTEVRVWRNYNGTHRIYVSLRSSPGEPWSLGIPTNIPDSPSGVAVGELPDGRVFLIGNQIAGELDDPDARPYRDPRKPWPFVERDFQPEHFPRDPLVLALSRDGRSFDRAWAIRHNTPDARFNGLGWLPGFQYPDAVVAEDVLWVLYSVNKEDMELLPIPINRLGP